MPSRVGEDVRPTQCVDCSTPIVQPKPAAKKADDVQIEDIDTDQPIDLSDIPF